MHWRSEPGHGLPERRSAAGRGFNPVLPKIGIAEKLLAKTR